MRKCFLKEEDIELGFRKRDAHSLAKGNEKLFPKRREHGKTLGTGILRVTSIGVNDKEEEFCCI